MADIRFTPATTQRSVRQIRQVVDPNDLYNHAAAVQQRNDAMTNADQQLTQDAITRRIQEQADAAAKQERARQAAIQAAQQRSSKQQSARDRAYQKSLQDQMNALQGQMTSAPSATGGMGAPTYDPNNTAPNHTKAYQRALNYANGQVYKPSKDWTHLCQSFARTAAHASAFGTSALNAWKSTPIEHRHNTYPPPPGSIAYYSNKAGTGAGHAVFVGDNGNVYSTDIKRTGKIDVVKWNTFQRKWNMVYLGWIDSTPSGALPIQGGVPSRPRTKSRK